jgi:redox-sensitive bicupin YhaK (pirin superfamily)
MSEILTHFPGPHGSLRDLRVVRLVAGDDHAQALDNGIEVWVQVIEGHVHVCGCELRTGQGVLLQSETVLAAYAQDDSLLLVAELKAGA